MLRRALQAYARTSRQPHVLTTPPLSTPRQFIAATVHETGLIFAFGGNEDNGKPYGKYVSGFQLYDPKAKTWTPFMTEYPEHLKKPEHRKTAPAAAPAPQPVAVS